MAENRRSRDGRVYFRRGQMVLLGGAFTLAAVVIFFLGIFVGKGIEERRMVKTEEPLVKIPLKPPASGATAAQGGQTKDDLTFYDTLTKSPGTQPLVEEKPVETKAAEKTAKAEVKDPKPQAKEKPAPPTVAEKKVAKVEPPGEEAKPAQTSETPARSENGKGWTVQVNAFPDERSAKLLVDRLKDKGYKAYMTEVRNKGKIWYRVRVGQYGTREEAREIEDALKTKENFTKTFATER